MSPAAAEACRYVSDTVTGTTPTVTDGANDGDGLIVFTCTAISPTTGPPADGTTVTITGTDLTGATAVTFTCNTSTTCTAVAPANGTGAGGTLATSPADQYTYAAAADLAVALSATGVPGLLGGHTDYTITIRALRPDQCHHHRHPAHHDDRHQHRLHHHQRHRHPHAG